MRFLYIYFFILIELSFSNTVVMIFSKKINIINMLFCAFYIIILDIFTELKILTLNINAAYSKNLTSSIFQLFIF